MSQAKAHYIFIIAVMISGCGGVTQVAPETQIVSTTPFAYSTVVPDNTTPTQVLPVEQYGVVKLSLEIIRNGKNYEMPLGYDVGRARWNQDSKIPDLPQTYDNKLNVNDINTQWIGDIDADGDLEYIVELVFCGTYCSSEVQIIHYDSAMDGYRVFDKFSGYGAENYLDADNDGNPEIVSQDYDYQFKAGGATATRCLSPIKIYQYNAQEQKFEVVTSKYSDLVMKDAVSFLEGAKTTHNDSNTNVDFSANNFIRLAAYLYDMYLLGKQDEGTKIFNDVCPQYIKPIMENPDWTCEDYLVRVQETLSEMKIRSE